MPRITLFLLLTSVAFVASCGGGRTTPAGSGPLSGNWQMSLQPSNSNAKPRTQSGFLVEQSDSLSGSLNFTGPVPSCCCAGVGSAVGTVKGSEVTLVVSPVGLSINLAGTLGSDQASMSGTYTTLSQGCINPQVAPETGMWTASLVKPLGGNFQGTFTSNKIGDLPATGMLSQAANVASTAPLSGNLTLTGYCFDTATVTGTISGTFVALNLLDSTGAQIGEVTAASSLDGKTLTGQYSILPQTTKPCTQGDRGTVTFSF